MFKVLELHNRLAFETMCNKLTEEGYVLVTASCGVTPGPDNWDYYYMAIFQKGEG